GLEPALFQPLTLSNVTLIYVLVIGQHVVYTSPCFTSFCLLCCSFCQVASGPSTLSGHTLFD
ncbi:hypothetical protein NDU88_008374, partial [Pleurodeles waltl]